MYIARGKSKLLFTLQRFLEHGACPWRSQGWLQSAHATTRVPTETEHKLSKLGRSSMDNSVLTGGNNNPQAKQDTNFFPDGARGQNNKKAF